MKDLTRDLVVYFYTAANEKIGYGHLIRQSLISSKLKKEKIKNFLLLDDIPLNFVKKNKLFHLSNFHILDILSNHKSKDNILIIIDRYSLTLNLQKKLKNKKIKTIIYDNIKIVSSKFILSDVIINIDPIIKKINYKKRSLYKNAKILTGLKYALVKQVTKTNRINKKYHFLVVLGGGDNLKILKKLIREFEKNYKNKTFLIILGFKNDKIKIKKNTINNYIIRNNVKNLETLMQNSEKILCSGGTVLLESMIYKISRNVIITADNQKSIVEYFFNKKLIDNYTQDHSKKDYKNFVENLSKKNFKINNLSQNYFNGVNRVFNIINKYT